MNRMMRKRRSVFVRYGLVVAVVWAVGTSVAWTCSTPVYRYAMYNWGSAPYRVFYFYEGEPPAKDQAVNERLDRLYHDDPAANVVFEAINVSQEGERQRLPDGVAQALAEAQEANAESMEPLHVVFSPLGVELAAQRLDVATVGAMVDSPMRRRLGQLLEQGNAAVLLILAGPDDARNRQVEKTVAEVIAKAAAGEIEVSLEVGASGTSVNFLSNADDASNIQSATAMSTLQIATVTLARDTPNEQWLVAALLAIEPDLIEFPNDPMVFTIYGRGRAMPPYLAKGITTDNLTECVAFIGGACSCMVKEENPGVDLPMQWDWEATADALAAEEEGDGGGPFGYQEFSPDDTGNWVASTADAATAAIDNGTLAVVAKAAGPRGSGDHAGSWGNDTSDTRSTSHVAAKANAAARENAELTVERQASEAFATRQQWLLGLGLGLGAIVVVTIGFLLAQRSGT